MHKFSTSILSITFMIGILLSLIELYASSDKLQHPLSSSIYYLITSLIMIFLLLKFSTDIVKRTLLINNFIIAIFAIQGVLLALICLYALEPKTKVEFFASSIFFFSSMLASGSVFFVQNRAEKNVEASNKTQEPI